jgi:TatD family-associated radical SAM protein
VFCGFGEPTEAFEVLKKVAAFVKETYHMSIRLNTNGLGNLVNGRDITPEMEGLIDTVSISLNTPNADRYHELVRSKFGDKSFDAMLDFARSSTKYVPNVVMTTVDTTITKEEEEECRRICDSIGAKYRIRPWED